MIDAGELSTFCGRVGKVSLKNQKRGCDVLGVTWFSDGIMGMQIGYFFSRNLSDFGENRILFTQWMIWHFHTPTVYMMRFFVVSRADFSPPRFVFLT